MTSPADGLRVLFLMRSPGFLRNFENVLRAMVGSGHHVTVAIENARKMEKTYRPLMVELEGIGVAFAEAPTRKKEIRHRLATQVRLGLDYLRYLQPVYDDRPKLRARAAGAAPPPVRRLADRVDLTGGGPGARVLRQGLHALDASAPVSPTVEEFLDAQPCDVLIVTPLVELGAPQTDWLRAARRRGIPTALGVASWDNLTVKGHLREWPDRVLVWNEAQREEASRLHGLPGERVIATGAHTYDHWFTWEPSRDREAFCAEVGLRPDRAIVLYLCSSPFIAPGESEYVESWVADLRASGHPELREAGVLVRPHPQHAAQWVGSEVDRLEQVVVWPRGGADPVAQSSRDDFFDSIHHCSAVAGVNTSALIESAIVGRQVLTVLDERYADTQRGTLHFAHLADPQDGILTVAASVSEHHEHLVRALEADASWDARRKRFLTHFVRPFGLREAAAPRFVAAVEDLAHQGGERLAAAPSSPAVAVSGVLWRRAPLGALVAMASSGSRRRVIRHGLRRVRHAAELAGALRSQPTSVTVGDVLAGRVPADTRTVAWDRAMARAREIVKK